MKNKILVAAVAVAIAAVGTSAFAATKLGSGTQKGSLLIFPRVEAITLTAPAPGASDTYIQITNDSSKAVRVQCYWVTTEQFPEAGPDTGAPIYGGNAGVHTWAAGRRAAIRNNHYMDFAFDVTKNQPVSFWAGDLSALSKGVNPVGAGPFGTLITTVNAPQFNFFQDGSPNANAGELKCWAVNAGNTKEIHHNHLAGKATIVTFADTLNAGAGQAHEYNAWSFQALIGGDNNIKHTGKVLGTPGLLKLDSHEYDSCPSALLGQFVPAGHSGLPTSTQVSLANCQEDLRQDGLSHITKLTYLVYDHDEIKHSGVHECMGAWYESELGAEFPAFQYRTLKSDAAYFTARPSISNKCNVVKQSGPADADIGISGIVGVQVNSVGGIFQTSSNLVGLGAGTEGDYAKGGIWWDPSPVDSAKK